MIPLIVMSLICFGKAVKQILYGLIPIKNEEQKNEAATAVEEINSSLTD